MRADVFLVSWRSVYVFAFLFSREFVRMQRVPWSLWVHIESLGKSVVCVGGVGCILSNQT